MRILALGLLVACGAEPVAPAVVPTAPIELPPAPEGWRADLSKKKASGFVLVPAKGAKWTSIEAARGASAIEPSEEVVVHEVVADHGDVVEVRPTPRHGGPHCYTGGYDSVARFSVAGFVRKRDLEVVLAETVVVEGEGDTRYEGRAGLRVREDEGERVAVAEGLRLPLPDSAPLSLSYSAGAITRFEPPAGRYAWPRDERAPEPIFVLPGAHLTAGDHTFSGREIAAHPQLEIARSATGDGDDRLVTLAAGCLSLRAKVAKEHLRFGYERRGAGGIGLGGIGGMGRGRLGPRGAPPPKEHHAPAGTRLFWRGTDRTAGELAAAFVTYPVAAPICLPVDQGFAGDPQICFAPSAVRRDCREPCREKGSCEESADGSRCVATSGEHCRASAECERRGSCTLRGEVCEAASDDDCAGSFDCERGPHACMAHEGRCIVTPNPDCESRPACKNEGRCQAGDRGECIAGSASDCAASAACARAGACASIGSVCQATTNDHCRQSAVCAEEGRCELEGRECVQGSSADCRRSRACTERGDCALHHAQRTAGLLGMGGSPPPEVGYCGPADEDDCARATRCPEGGRCRVESAWGRTRCAFFR